MIKYKYANNEDGCLVDIYSASKSNKYYCVSCGKELIPKTGKIRQWHFAHKNTEIVCSSETYLHILGKQTFYNTYKNCIKNNEPFYIEIERTKICNCYEKEFHKTCTLSRFVVVDVGGDGSWYEEIEKHKLERIDITKYFTKIFYEKRVDDFIPDLYLTNESADESLFIEIAVTHEITDKKHDSKYRIIEIKMETEDDISLITGKILSKDNKKIKFLNFKKKEKIGNFCNGKCENHFHFLKLDKNGRVLLKTMTLSEISKYISFHKENILKYEVKDITHKDILIYTTKKYEYSYERYVFTKFVAECAMENLKVRNCFICRYHALNDNVFEPGPPIFCKFLKKVFNSNNAVECEYFRKEKKYIEEIINDYCS
jgi:competence CoiA-like predicted nuclease